MNLSKFLLYPKAILILFVFLIASCSKKVDRLAYAKQMLAGKNWYLMFSTQENQTKSFVDKSTYSIQFLDNQKTIDSDGISGTYQVTEQKDQLHISVAGTTQKGISANYTYQIDHIEATTLKISYTQNNILIQKIFMTNR
jgi:hypothetical protein